MNMASVGVEQTRGLVFGLCSGVLLLPVPLCFFSQRKELLLLLFFNGCDKIYVCSIKHDVNRL